MLLLATAVDLSQDDARLPNVEPAVPGDHDLAATLNALNQAANSGSFGPGSSSGGQPGQLNPDMLDHELLSRWVYIKARSCIT